MIEQVLIFLLGFLTAALLALACLPAVWQRAMRLSTRRLSQLVPLSMDEIVAERDQMRAAFAVELRRLEQRLERAEAVRSQALVEQGRLAAALGSCEAALGRSTTQAAELGVELARAQRARHEAEGQAGALVVALQDVSDIAERRRWEILDAEGRIRMLDLAVDIDRAAGAGFETRVTGLESRIEDLRKALSESLAENARLAERARQAVNERDALLDETDFPALRQAIAKLADDLLDVHRTASRAEIEPGATA